MTDDKQSRGGRDSKRGSGERGGGQDFPHLKRGQHYLFHGGEVGLPEELSLLSEGQDLILVDGAHRGRDLRRTKGQPVVTDLGSDRPPRRTQRHTKHAERWRGQIADATTSKSFRSSLRRVLTAILESQK